MAEIWSIRRKKENVPPPCACGQLRVRRDWCRKPVLDPDEEVQIVGMLLAVEHVRNDKAKVLVLSVGKDFRHFFQGLGELLFSGFGVSMGNMAAIGTGGIKVPT